MERRFREAAWVTASVAAIASALLGALVLVFGECVEVAAREWVAFAGPWEVTLVWKRIVPLGWVAAMPAALFGALLAGGARAAVNEAGAKARAARAALALAGAAFGAWLGIGISSGRHFESLSVRAAFVAVLAAVAAAAAAALLPAFERTLGTRPIAGCAIALAAAAGLETSNLLVLPRLYPAFHQALGLLTIALAPWIGRPLVQATNELVRQGVQIAGRAMSPAAREHIAAFAVPTAVLLGAAGAKLGARASAAPLALADNLRWMFVDRAPLAERGLALGAKLVPAPALDDGDEGEAPARADTPRPSGRPALDWRGRDIVLLTVDALRADHVGAYGYARATTPKLDEIARSGVLFTHAYCPTPHTSYSVTSLMTGKNMRPLLVQGLGADSDTMAALLRRYDYRTAAFYPPAVFFIDENRFTAFRDDDLDFEYARVQFADPAERVAEVSKYLSTATTDHPLFLWVHLFEPHEPYIAHPEHPFGDRDVDRYDSEIAAADQAIGEIAALVRKKRPRALTIVTADHGEEFGDHGGRYHGTSVYEEQIRVPLVVAGDGVESGRVDLPVQTIDLLPTLLAALDIPRPARIRGNDIGPLLAAAARREPAPDGAAGFAFAETDDETFLASGALRLLCDRRSAACALYDVAVDPAERNNVASAHRQEMAALKQKLRRWEASQGDLERAPAEETSAAEPAEGLAKRPKLPGALRRALAGDADAALEVSGFLDDADPQIRERSAEALFDLRSPDAEAALRLARDRSDDEVVRRYSALSLVRLGEPPRPKSFELLSDPDLRWRRAAALSLAEAGDGRGTPVLVEWWQHHDELDVRRARELLDAFARVRAISATGPLVRSLDDVRLRAYIARALGSIGDRSARRPLLERFATERYHTAREALAEALVELGATAELGPPLVRFLGTPDPLAGGLGIASRAGILPLVGGAAPADLAPFTEGSTEPRSARIRVTVAPGIGRPENDAWRLIVRGASLGSAESEVRVAVSPADGRADPPAQRGERRAVLARIALPPGANGAAQEAYAAVAPDPSWPLAAKGPSSFVLDVEAPPRVRIDAIALVRPSEEIAPPPPAPWQNDERAATNSRHPERDDRVRIAP